MMQSLLDAEGIPSFLKDENTVVTAPYLSNAIGGVKLLVPQDQMERAMEILTQAGHVKPEEPGEGFVQRHRALLFVAIVFFFFLLISIVRQLPNAD